MTKNDSDHYTPEETEQRLRKTLKAAFYIKPTPLKAIRKIAKDRKVAKVRSRST